MKCKGMLTSVSIAVSLAVASGIAISATQDKYSVRVPNGLAFSEFRGYEKWELIAVSCPGGNGVKTNTFFCVLHCETSGHCIETALGDHRNRRIYPRAIG